MSLYIVAPTAEERYKGWFDLMGMCRASVERMSFNITTGEVWFNARARDGDVASQLVSGVTTSPVRFGVFPIRSSSVTFIRDPWSQPPPPTGNVTVPLVRAV